MMTSPQAYNAKAAQKLITSGEDLQGECPYCLAGKVGDCLCTKGYGSWYGNPDPATHTLTQVRVDGELKWVPRDSKEALRADSKEALRTDSKEALRAEMAEIPKFVPKFVPYRAVMIGIVLGTAAACWLYILFGAQ